MISSIYPQTGSVPNSKGNSQVRYPEDIQIIIRSDTHTHGNLFLSNLQAAENLQLLQKLQIAAVITATKGHHLQHPKNIVRFTKYIPLEDDQKCQIYDFLEETVSFIDQKLKSTNVLVHCVSGISKSAALVMAFIMQNRHLTLQDAFNEVKSRRKIIAPHNHILTQLKKYELDLQQKVNINRLQTDKPNPNNLTIKSNRLNYPSPYDKLKTQNSHLSRVSDRDRTIQTKIQPKGLNNRLLPSDLDQVKSMRSYRSNNSRRSNQIFIQVNEPIRNPEESFISKRSQQKSFLNKSFAKSRASSQNNLHDLELQQFPEPPNLIKKNSQSRQQFTKKMRKVDSLNEEINIKIDAVQERFQTENKVHKQNLDKELSEIYQMKTHIYSQQSDRKSRLATKKSLHNESMEDPNVKNYIYNLPIPGLTA